MTDPQPPELDTDVPGGPVPVDNQPGHHPEQEQDKPDLDAFAERLGVTEESGADARTVADSPAPAPPGPRGVKAVVAALVAAVAVVVGVLARRRRRSHRTG